jgi:chromosome segregation ATPase
VQLEKEQRRCKDLEASLQESGRCMEEAVRLSDERTRRTESLVKERHELEQRLDEYRKENALAAKKINQLNEECEQARDSLRYMEAELNLARGEVDRHKSAVAQSELEMQRRLESARALEDENKRLEHQMATIESRNKILQREALDKEETMRTQASQISVLEETNIQLRDKLFDAQKRIDTLLRSANQSRGTSEPHASASQLDTPHQYSRIAASSASARSDSLRPQGRSSQPHLGFDARAGPGGTAERVRDWEERINALLNSRAH